MACLTPCLYPPVLGFVRSVKWIELQFLKLFSPLIIKEVVRRSEIEFGAVFHFTEDSYKNWGPEEEAKALKKCSGKHDSLVHIRVWDKMVLVHAINTYSWGMGEGNVNGLWGWCEDRDERDLTELTRRFMEHDLSDLYYNWWNRFLYFLEHNLFNLQRPGMVTEVGEKHYDLGNDLFETFLDPWMQYTCGYWANADNLNDAQLAKLELIAKKLQLKPGMRLLDIGCGWGMLCKYFAEKYGVECVGITISKQQVEYGQRACKGLPVEIRFQDYRKVNEKFDRIVSVGMFEHVGPKNHKKYFKVAHRNLKEDGIFLLHTIGRNHIKLPQIDRWMNTRIFQNAAVPRPKDITKGTEPYFVIEDWHNFGDDYSKTLLAWKDNFLKGWPSIKGNYGEKFYRMWLAYLAGAPGVFLARKLQLWQVVLSKKGLKGGYRSVR